VLPIYRLAADDPDEENTLATAVFTLDANHVRWQIFDINRDDAEFQGEVRNVIACKVCAGLSSSDNQLDCDRSPIE
jgi:hypothetical protein